MKLAPIKHLDDAHDDGVWCAAWAPATSTRGQLLLTGSIDESVRLWEGDELKPVRTNTGHALGVVALATDASGQLAASSSLDSLVRVFDVYSNETKATLECQPAESWGLAFDPQGKYLAVAGGCSGKVKLFKTENWQLDTTLEMPEAGGAGEAAAGGQHSSKDRAAGRFVLAVAWSVDGKRLAASTMDGTVAIFDTGRWKLLHTLEGHRMPVRSLAFSPADSRVLFTASDDAHVHMYDAEGRTLVAGLSGHTSWVLSVTASEDGAAIATGSSDRTVRLWDLSMRAAVQVQKEHKDQVWAVAFRPAGGEGVRVGRLVSVSDDKSIALADYA